MSSTASPRAEAEPSLAPLAVASWVLFDFAATLFSYVVLTRYFNEWIVIELDQPDYLIGFLGLAVALLLLLGLPFFGALSDRAGRHKPFLIVFALASIAGTALLGVVEGVGLALLVAGIAIFAFNSAEAQYHPLLASVAPPPRQSLVSGIGIATGYVGTIVALFVLGAIVAEGDNQEAFLPTAALYLAFALPCLLFVRDRSRTGTGEPPPARPTLAGLPGEVLGDLAASLRRARGRPHGRLLVARFLYVDAIATVIAFMTIYARRTGDFSSAELNYLLGLSTAFAIVGALVAGLLVPRVGPQPILIATLVAVSGALVVAGVSGSSALLWVVGPIVGAALGVVSATDRVFMLRLVPAGRRGDAFGLYALIGKVSNGFGPLVLWSGTVFLLSQALAVSSEFDASRVAVCVLAGAALLGAWVLRGLPNPRTASESSLGAPAAPQ